MGEKSMHIIRSQLRIVPNGKGGRWERAYFPVSVLDMKALSKDTELDHYLLVLDKNDLRDSELLKKVAEIRKIVEIEEELAELRGNAGLLL